MSPEPAIAVLPMGERAVLVTHVADPAAWVLGLRALGAAVCNELVDVVPAAETVLVTCTTAAALAALRPHLDTVVPVPTEWSSAPPIIIPVRYDGADLEEVARAAGLSVGDVITIHSGAQYTAAFCGFSPGFAYLRGLPARLHLPRRPSPRTRVPAGAVAIASQYTAVYPRPSPGGWHLLGSTDLVMFDPHDDPPARLQPGTRVRFEAV